MCNSNEEKLIPVDAVQKISGKWELVQEWVTPAEQASLAEEIESEERLMYNTETNLHTDV